MLMYFLVCILSSTGSQAQSPVWKISQGAHHLYIGGTVHLLSKDDYPLPLAFDNAYQNATRLIFETDILALRTPATANRLARAMLAQDGRSLQSRLQPETWKALKVWLRAQSIPLDRASNWSVTGAGMMITLHEMQKLGLSSDNGVDHYFGSKAQREGKALGQLESIEQHLAFLQNLAQGKEDEFIRHTLADIHNLPATMNDIKQAWRHGDHQALEAFGIKEIKADFPHIYQALLSDRNQAWLPQIEHLLKTDEIELILVGALHLVGEDGVLALLKQRGYEVVNL